MDFFLQNHLEKALKNYGENDPEIAQFYIIMKCLDMEACLIFYHIFIFLSPAFYLSEYKKIKNILFIITIFYCLSLLFFYYLLLPLSLNFFLKFQTLNNQVIKIYFEGKIIEYLNFYIYMYFICIMFFQSFVYIYIYLINKNIIDFVKFRKSSYFIFYFFSTLLTPPDLFSQLIMGLIFVILLEILLVFIFINKYVKKSQILFT